jgi:hypothetical protein
MVMVAPSGWVRLCGAVVEGALCGFRKVPWVAPTPVAYVVARNGSIPLRTFFEAML